MDGDRTNSEPLMKEASQFSASLEKRGLHYRSFHVTTPEGIFVVEYRARGIGDETISVNGQVIRRSHSTWWYVPAFRFHIGSAEAQLAVRFWPWLTFRALTLIVAGQVIHTEGSTESMVAADALSGLISDTLASGGVRLAADQTALIPAAANIVCDRRPSGVTLTHRWFSWLGVVLVPFCFAWDAVVAAAYGFALAQRAPFWVHLLLLPFLLAAVYFSYYTLSKLLNRTMVELDTGTLSIRHRPLPWPGARQVPISDVKQFHCQERALTDHRGDTWMTYTLSALLDDGREIELLSSIGSSGAAEYLEQEVSRLLSA